MLTVTVTFVQATFVLATFVNSRNISAVTDPILKKLFGPNIRMILRLRKRLKLSKGTFRSLRKSLNSQRKKIIDSISNPEGYRVNNILIGVYSATFDEDEMNFGTDEADVVNDKPKKGTKVSERCF